MKLFKREETITEDEESVKDDVIEFQASPIITFLNLDSNIIDEFKKLGYNTNGGSFGTPIKIIREFSTNEVDCYVNAKIPQNFHESDIVVIDLTIPAPVNYDPKGIEQYKFMGNSADVLISKYPENIFNPIPLFCGIIALDIQQILQRRGIVIFFANRDYNIEYNIAKIRNRNRNDDVKKSSLYSFLPIIPNLQNKNGTEFKVLPNTKFQEY